MNSRIYPKEVFCKATLEYNERIERERFLYENTRRVITEKKKNEALKYFLQLNIYAK